MEASWHERYQVDMNTQVMKNPTMLGRIPWKVLLDEPARKGDSLIDHILVAK
jgi:hypothetical protein